MLMRNVDNKAPLIHTSLIGFTTCMLRQYFLYKQLLLLNPFKGKTCNVSSAKRNGIIKKTVDSFWNVDQKTDLKLEN